MSRTYSKLTNENQKHSKVHFKQYLYSANEPHGYISDGLPAELEAELLENYESMRQNFRDRASRLRRQ